MTAALHLELQRSELRVDPPLVNANTIWRQRTIGTLQLKMSAAGATVGWGEASPLPGYSLDDDAEVDVWLHGLAGAALARLAACDTARDLLAAVVALPAGPAAARFGLETALLDRLARAAGQPLWRVLAELAGTGFEPRRVALCALLPSSDAAAATALAERHMSAGVRTFKLKVGPDRLQPEQEATLEALRERWGPDIALRLDANGSLARADLPSTLARIGRFEPELVEEPLANAAPEELAQAPCPLALDESLAGLAEDERERRLERSRASAVVLKPTTLGGLGACLRLAQAARQLGCEPIVSHALEGPIGWGACAHLALGLAAPRAAGLWPLGYQRASAPELSAGHLLAPSAAGLGAIA